MLIAILIILILGIIWLSFLYMICWTSIKVMADEIRKLKKPSTSVVVVMKNDFPIAVCEDDEMADGIIRCDRARSSGPTPNAAYHKHDFDIERTKRI